MSRYCSRTRSGELLMRKAAVTRIVSDMAMLPSAATTPEPTTRIESDQASPQNSAQYQPFADKGRRQARKIRAKLRALRRCPIADARRCPLNAHETDLPGPPAARAA